MRRISPRSWQVRAEPRQSSAPPAEAASDLDLQCSPDQRKGASLFERLRPSLRLAIPFRPILRAFERESGGDPSPPSPPPRRYSCWRSFGQRLLALLRISSWCGVAV